jgi:thioredoxin family protein
MGASAQYQSGCNSNVPVKPKSGVWRIGSFNPRNVLPGIGSDILQSATFGAGVPMNLCNFRKLGFLILLLTAILSPGQTTASPSTVADQPFAPLEKWKSMIVAGDADGLKKLYSSNPVAHVMTASGSVDADAVVHYWIGMKVREMKIAVVQSRSPQPGAQQIAFQAEIRSAASGTEQQTLYVTEVQLWQQQGSEWRVVVSKRTDTTRLQQPTSAKNIYEAKADARVQIKDALAKAAKEHKRVLVIFGANWCYDCHVLDLALERADIAPVLEENYEVVHVDIGEGDKNQDLMKEYEVPPERGIPAAAVLDSAGKLVFSQKHGEFEKARSLGPEDLLEFLGKWKSGTGKS